MKTKIKQHYRSVVSVLLSVCMLVSCMTVGLIATDAARVTDNDEVAASVDTIDEVAAAAESDDAVGASADTEESVGSGAGYILKSDNDKPSHAGDTGVTVTKSGNNYTATLPIALFEINRNYYIMLSSSTSYSNSFFQNSNITVSKANGSTQISGCGSQSRDQYRMARFSLSTKDGISGIKVVVSGTSKTYTLSTVSSATTTYSVTVNAGANGSVVAGSTAITAGNSATVSVAQGSNISLVATPVQGYSFKEWRTVSGNCSVASPTSASTTLSATANGGTVTATYIKNATAKRRIYYDNSSTNWTTPYAYAELSDGTPCLGTAPGTAMSHDSTDDVWYIDVNAEVAKIQFSGNSTGTGASELRTDIPDYLNPEFYDYNGLGSGGSWKKHEAKTLPNEVNAVLSNDVKNNANLFTNIKASFFDYLTDDEIGPGKSWYTSIKPLEDGWIAEDYTSVTDENYWNKIKRNPYKALNKALSAYANKNSVKYPLYFGAFYTDPSYKNPGYFRSARKLYGHLINDSNQLGDSNDVYRWYRSLPGLAGTSIADGSIHYASSSGGNGAPMVLFDKEWLNSRTTESNSDTSHRIYFDPGDQWSQAGDYRVVQHGNDWWDGKKVTYDSTLGIYYFDLEEHTDKIRFVRTNSSLGDNTFKVRGSDGKLIWNNSEELGGDWAYNYTDSISLSSDNMYLMTNWTTYETKKFYGHYSNYQYGGKLGQVVNSQFPVVKRTTNNGKVTYYEFNSNNATDNIWFDNLTTSTNPTLNYGSGTSKGVKAGYVDSQTYGFFPFDKYDRNNGHGKDLGFGMKLEIEFTLGPNGQVQGTDGNWYDQIFYFSGDDDLWVYVDDTLLLDLGGDHKMSEATVNFHSRSISTTRTPNTSITAEQGTARNQNFTWLENNDTSKIHKMTIYYMERGMQESNLKFGFSFYPVDNKFVTTEEMSYDGVNPALASDVAELAKNDSIVVTHYADKNDTPSTLAAEKTYRLNAEPTNSSTGATGTYTLKAGDKATFLKQFDDGSAGSVGSLTTNPDNFRLTAADGASNVFTYNTIVKGVTDVKNDKVIPVTGTDKNIFTFRTLKDPKYDTDPTDIQADLLSTIKTKNLMITKDLAGAEDTEHPFTLKIEIDLDGAGSKKDYQVYELPYLLNGTSGTLPDTGLIDVKKDDIIIISGIPEKANVRISEQQSTIYEDYEYLSTDIFKQSDDTEVTKTAYSITDFEGASFTLLDDDFAIVTNKKKPTYSLNVKKETDTDDTTGSYDFYVMKVTGTSPVTLTPIADGNYELINSDGTTGTVAASSGKISLTKDQQFVIPNIHKGDVYLVYEGISNLPDNYDYFDTEVTGTSEKTINPTVNSVAYKGAKVTFNETDIPVVVTNKTKGYEVTITKIMYNGYESGDQTFDVKVELDSGSGYVDATKYYDSTDTEQTFASGFVALKKGDTIKLKSLVTGTKVKVTEPAMPTGTTYTYYSCVGSDTFTAATPVTNNSNVEIGKEFTVGTAAGAITLTNHHPVNYYTIEFNYPCYKNLYGTDSVTNQTYVVHDVIGADLAEYFDIAADGSTGNLNRDDDKVNQLIALMAPHENNFRSDLWYDKTCIEKKPDGTTWDINWRESRLQNGHYSDGEITFRLTAKTAGLGYLICDFKVPYSMDIDNNTIVVESDAYTESGTTINVTPTFMSRYYLDNDASGENYFWAKEELSGDADHKYFQYWNIWRKGEVYTPENVIRRCFNPKFNYTFYESYHIEAVYGSTKHTPTEWSEEYGINASISFLENSRNQWNMGHGNQVGTVEKSYWQYRGDRVFSDFAISYAYNDLQLQLSSNDAIKTYMVIERLGVLPNLQNDSGPVLDSHGVNVKDTSEETINSMIANVADDGKETLKKSILSGSDGGRVYIKSEIAKADLDNKNCIEYYYNFANRKQEDKTQPNDQIIPYLSDYTTVRNYLFRAYAVITDGTQEGTAVSDPAYFTVYDIASIENYHQKHYVY